MLPALVSTALVVAIAMALLESALVNAKIESQHVAARIVSSALARGTGDFVAWAARSVTARGAATTWTGTTVSDGTQSACTANDPGCGASIAISFAVAGSTANTATGDAVAENLQGALHENRVSATVSASFTDRAGDVLGSATRLVTIRVFDAPPYAIVSGVRDARTMASNVGARQGDTAGTLGTQANAVPPTPDPARPAADTDTTIAVTMTCANSAANANASDPFLDNNAPGNDGEPWGVSGGAGFEAPCEPTYPFSGTPGVPWDARARIDDAYDIGSFSTARWASNAAPPSSWAP